MDLEKLEQVARSAKSRSHLEQLCQNVRERGDSDAIYLVTEILLERFPIQARSRTGKNPTEATFRQQKELFETGKEAYLWLLEEFRQSRPGALERFGLLQGRNTRAIGRRFAKSAAALFPPGSSRASKASYWAKLGDGWFTDVNLDHAAKFATLLSVGRLCGLAYLADWDFQPVGSTDALREHQESVIRAQEIVAEFFRESDA